MAERLWVVSPSYTDVPAFEILRARIRDVVSASELSSCELRFVLVDDTGGVDPEMARLAQLVDVRVVCPPFNLGHQRAIVFGLRTIEPELEDEDLVVTMDADGEDRPEDLVRVVAPLLDSPDARHLVCLARRTHRRESARFKAMYFLFRIMFRTLTGVTVRSGNFAAYRGWLARRMLQHPYFDLCYSSSLVSLDIPLAPVPCPRGERFAGRSRMNSFRLFMHGLGMLMPFTDRIAVRALTTFSVLFGTGILASLTVLALRLFTSVAIPGWVTVTLISVLILAFLTLGNFVVLFVVFSHSRGISLVGLERKSSTSPG